MQFSGNDVGPVMVKMDKLKLGSLCGDGFPNFFR